MAGAGVWEAKRPGLWEKTGPWQRAQGGSLLPRSNTFLPLPFYLQPRPPPTLRVYYTCGIRHPKEGQLEPLSAAAFMARTARRLGEGPLPSAP